MGYTFDERRERIASRQRKRIEQSRLDPLEVQAERMSAHIPDTEGGDPEALAAAILARMGEAPAKVHTGAGVTDMLMSKGAEGAAIGGEIYAMSPDPSLIAHEAVHVAQQRQGVGGGEQYRLLPVEKLTDPLDVSPVEMPMKAAQEEQEEDETDAPPSDENEDAQQEQEGSEEPPQEEDEDIQGEMIANLFAEDGKEEDTAEKAEEESGQNEPLGQEEKPMADKSDEQDTLPAADEEPDGPLSGETQDESTAQLGKDVEKRLPLNKADSVQEDLKQQDEKYKKKKIRVR